MPPRLIAHLDMDAFYASVELLRYPDLAGEPVVIGGGRRHAPEPLPGGGFRYARLRDYAGRGVVTTASYAARAFGVHSAMGMMKAAQLAPQAVLLPTDFERYREFSRRFKAAAAAIAPRIEDRGIDEIYLDLSGLPGTAGDGGRAVAQALKAAVFEATGLRCSIGVAPNKLLAKICSDLDKPDGLTLLAADEIPTRIWPLPARKINGIGPKASERLAGFGIHRIGELAAADPAWLVETFGRSYGAWLHEAAHGRDERPVVTHSEPVSISRETTFERDLHAVRDRATLSALFTELCVKLAGDLQRKGYVARNVAIKLRFDDFRIVSRAVTLPAHTADAAEIRRAAGQCLKRVDLSRRLRLLGVRAAALLPAAEAARRAAALPPRGETLPLFDARAPAGGAESAEEAPLFEASAD
ncbi:DNA polymerase IV [Piscinibacter sakaiensis]|uniref:DNA polymerase IV n=1 Tax=Piscinibacter sakaiensis TaxID=1547922 RepID=A0A0K8NTK7_PISS1|nr:DNA polymerase IV [Piscinibacter sakaiensis]GAP33746.1 DNA polymerase IV [Piscinibacter sakaiensis]